MKAKLTFREKEPWSGRSIYKNCRHGIQTYLKRSGVRYTGLENDDNLRIRLEKILNFPDGYLKPQSDFWDSFTIWINDSGELRLDTEGSPEDELKYYFLRNHKDVAQGLKDRKPSADYVLLQEETEAKEQNVKARIKRKAMVEFSKLTPSQMRKALRLYGYNSTNVSEEIVENRLFDLVEENPQRFLTIWVNNTNKDIQFLIEEAVAKNILRKNKTMYKYGTDVIGSTLDDAIIYLSNPVNNDVRIAILSQLENKESSFGEQKIQEVKGESELDKIKQEIKEETKSKKVVKKEE